MYVKAQPLSAIWLLNALAALLASACCASVEASDSLHSVVDSLARIYAPGYTVPHTQHFSERMTNPWPELRSRQESGDAPFGVRGDFNGDQRPDYSFVASKCTTKRSEQEELEFVFVIMVAGDTTAYNVVHRQVFCCFSVAGPCRPGPGYQWYSLGLVPPGRYGHYEYDNAQERMLRHTVRTRQDGVYLANGETGDVFLYTIEAGSLANRMVGIGN